MPGEDKRRDDSEELGRAARGSELKKDDEGQSRRTKDLKSSEQINCSESREVGGEESSRSRENNGERRDEQLEKVKASPEEFQISGESKEKREERRDLNGKNSLEKRDKGKEWTRCLTKEAEEIGNKMIGEMIEDKKKMEEGTKKEETGRVAPNFRKKKVEIELPGLGKGEKIPEQIWKNSRTEVTRATAGIVKIEKCDQKSEKGAVSLIVKVDLRRRKKENEELKDRKKVLSEEEDRRRKDDKRKRKKDKEKDEKEREEEKKRRDEKKIQRGRSQGLESRWADVPTSEDERKVSEQNGDRDSLIRSDSAERRRKEEEELCQSRRLKQTQTPVANRVKVEFTKDTDREKWEDSGRRPKLEPAKRLGESWSLSPEPPDEEGRRVDAATAGRDRECKHFQKDDRDPKLEKREEFREEESSHSARDSELKEEFRGEESNYLARDSELKEESGQRPELEPAKRLGESWRLSPEPPEEEKEETDVSNGTDSPRNDNELDDSEISWHSSGRSAGSHSSFGTVPGHSAGRNLIRQDSSSSSASSSRVSVFRG